MSTAFATPSRIVILGVTGDLARRYLFPALSRLEEAGRLPAGLDIVGVGRSALSDEDLRSRLRPWLPVRDEPGRTVIDRIRYQQAQVDDPAALADVMRSNAPVVVYLALPPSVFGATIEAVHEAGSPTGSRIVIEKPFGEDPASAQRLNALLHASFPEDAVFRIDHFLHRQTIQNVLGLRFANRVFEPLWNRDHIERIEIRWDETVGLEGRAGYYDHAGALRDMIQNHLLQLACLVGMEPPAAMGARDLRDRKVEFLRAVRRLSPQEVGARTLRARYTAGRIGQRDLPAYVSEEGVDPDRHTETFAEVALEVDNWRWSGVPFVLRTGKAMGHDRREIIIVYRDVPHLAFGEAFQPVRNRLRFEINPDRLALDVNVNGAGDPFILEELELGADLSPDELPAYARLLLDVIEGDPTLSIRDDETEESWRIAEPILDAWRDGASPMLEYAAGSNGPSGSRLAGNGRNAG
jgi:glucose-6-phosphate 1-dehydrogenase